MKSKAFTFVFLALFLVGLVSAAVLYIPTSTITVPTSVNQDDGIAEITFDLVNSGVEATLLDVDESTIDQTAAGVTLSISPTSIGDGSTSEVTESIIVTVDFDDTYTGTISGTIVVDPSGVGDSKEFNFTLEVFESEEPQYCEVDKGDLRVTIEDINVVGYGDDDDYWYMFDEIEVEIDVENKNDERDIDDVEIEWGLWSEDLDEWVIELDEEDEFDVKDDDTETLTFTFDLDDRMDVDIDDLEEGDIILVVVGNGQQQGIDDDNKDEFDVCSFDTQDVELVIDDDFVILQSIKISETAQPGETIQVSGDIWNIGDDDQEEVKIIVTSSALDLEREIDVGDIDALDDDSFSFSFTVPSDMNPGSYPIRFEVEDEDGDIFENEEDDESSFSIVLKVEGEGSTDTGSTADVSIDASLESDAVPGEELIVSAMITNTGSDRTTYQIILTNFNDWATLESVEPRSLSLEPGDSEQVMITITPNADATGSNEFTLQVVFEGNVEEQRISVPLGGEGKGTGLITGSVIGGSINDNWFIWLIVLLNVVLVVLIIVVAVRMAKKG